MNDISQPTSYNFPEVDTELPGAVCDGWRPRGRLKGRKERSTGLCDRESLRENTGDVSRIIDSKDAEFWSTYLP